MFDTHIHTLFSSDSNLKIEELLSILNENPEKGMIITEHMDYKYPVKGLFVFDCDEYFEEYDRYRGENLLLGIELGLREDCQKRSFEIINDKRFDYVLGSVHTIDGVDIANGHFFERYDEKELMVIYLNRVSESIDLYKDIDSLGHIDFITRYSGKENSKFIIPETIEILNEIVRKLVNNDISVEINTRRIHVKNAYDELKQFLELYREVGGKCVTIGSDSHNDSAPFSNFEIAKKLVGEVGLEIVYYKNRQKIIDRW